jgi:hypothetical protein
VQLSAQRLPVGLVILQLVLDGGRADSQVKQQVHHFHALHLHNKGATGGSISVEQEHYDSHALMAAVLTARAESSRCTTPVRAPANQGPMYERSA